MKLRNTPAAAVLSFLILISAASVRAASVSGTVQRSGTPPTPIPNARVTLFEPTLQNFFETRTNAQGAFAFANLPLVDVWRLAASSLGREYVEIQAVVEGGSFQHNFVLGPEIHPGQWNIVGNTLPEFFDATDIAILRADGKVFFCHDTGRRTDSGCRAHPGCRP